MLPDPKVDTGLCLFLCWPLVQKSELRMKSLIHHLLRESLDPAVMNIPNGSCFCCAVLLKVEILEHGAFQDLIYYSSTLTTKVPAFYKG